MDLTNQVATLQDEVKLLKGEIKAVLKEIRTAVLSQDNPFSSDSGTPAFQPVNHSAGDDSGEPANKQTNTPEIPDVAAIAIPTFGAPPAAPPAAPLALPPAAEPAPPPATAPGPPPAAEPASIEPIPLRPSAEQTQETDWANEPDDELDDKPDDAQASTHGRAQAWSITSIAGLAIWAEEALQALGPRRYQFVLKLAAFAELLTPEAQEVLGSMDESDPGATADDRSVTVNECLVVLRQLDAIVHGERVIRLPRRRGARLRRVR